jgi:hypothetical protein
MPYLQKLNKIQTEHKVTMTHLVSKGLSIAIAKMRRDIGRIKWGYVRARYLLLFIVPTLGKVRRHNPS